MFSRSRYFSPVRLFPATAMLMMAACLCGGISFAPASAQAPPEQSPPEQAPPEATNQPAAANDPALGLDTTLDAMFANRLMQLSFRSLAGQSKPTKEQLDIATLLMDMSLGIVADDAEAWLNRVELASLAGHDADYEKALRQYIRLIPEDDAAQLKLIMHRVARLNTLDDRIGMLERVLNAESASRLSSPLRSRLATSAAVFARELGDADRHLAHLRTAVKLDPANPAATRLTYQYALGMNANAVQLGSLLVSVIRSAPLDHNARLGMAYALSEQAAYTYAAQQFQAASQLSSGPLSLEEYRQWALCLAASGQVRELDALLTELRGYLAAMETPQPMPIDLELIHLASIDRDAADEQATAIVTRISETLGVDTLEGEPAMVARAQLATILAVYGNNTERVEPLLADAPADHAFAQIARGWAAIHAGEAEKARALLAVPAQTEPLARLGLAMLPSDPDAGTTRALLELMHSAPTHIAGLLAAQELRRTRRSVTPTAAGTALTNLMDRSPNDLWRIELDKLRWVDVSLDLRPQVLKFGEPINARLTLRNRSQLPLAIGPDGVIPTEAVFIINATVSGQPLPPVGLTIADAARRLTLAPGESLTFGTRLDRGPLYRVIEQQMYSRLSFSTLVIVDPRQLPSGSLVAGAMGGADRANVNQLFGRPATPENIDRWLTDLDGRNTGDRARAIALLAQAGSAQPGASVQDDALALIAEQLNERFPRWTPREQAWAVLFIPPSDGMGRPTQPMLDLAKASDDPAVYCSFLISQVSDPDSPVIVVGLRHANRQIREFAAAYQLMLRQQAQGQTPPDEPAPE